jgi:hypothetical protein
VFRCAKSNSPSSRETAREGWGAGIFSFESRERDCCRISARTFLEAYEKSCLLYPSRHVDGWRFGRSFWWDSDSRDEREPRFPKGEPEAAEGAEEVCEGATESGAQNAEGGEKKHNISAAAILIDDQAFRLDSEAFEQSSELSPRNSETKKSLGIDPKSLIFACSVAENTGFCPLLSDCKGRCHTAREISVDFGGLSAISSVVLRARMDIRSPVGRGRCERMPRPTKSRALLGGTVGGGCPHISIATSTRLTSPPTLNKGQLESNPTRRIRP